ncbi:hypothetical protein C8R41DRAFT_849328 [Lentinula lateritia]|uniref:Uncharacterized protein n=1 Tax=Lentinula lateritia TaxID=40482 RepID=A0ABQ8V694_9AGAR|nr:hypothetical protein C8R41DRAFT_849328 [Lentinula lateritia]
MPWTFFYSVDSSRQSSNVPQDHYWLLLARCIYKCDPSDCNWNDSDNGSILSATFLREKLGRSQEEKNNKAAFQFCGHFLEV